MYIESDFFIVTHGTNPDYHQDMGFKKKGKWNGTDTIK